MAPLRMQPSLRGVRRGAARVPAPNDGARQTGPAPRRPQLTPDLLFRLRSEWLGNIRGDLLAGLVVALALIPEAIAFSIIAGVDPKIGLYASFSIAVVSPVGACSRVSKSPAATARGRACGV